MDSVKLTPQQTDTQLAYTVFFCLFGFFLEIIVLISKDIWQVWPPLKKNPWGK